MSHVIANGVRIEYETHGGKDDPAIILMRGLGTQLIDWSPVLIDALTAGGYRVVTFDNRDVGLSQKFEGNPDIGKVAKGEQAPPYSVDEMALDVIGLMDELGIAKAHLVGISMGGMIAQVVAAKHGERLISMHSIMSSSGRPGLPGPTEAAQAQFRRDAEASDTLEEVIETTAQGMAVYGSPAYPEPHGERLAMARRRVERCHCPEGVQRQMAAIVASGSREELLRSIHIPVAVIHGRDDPLVPVEAGIDTAELIAGAELTLIDGMGHNIPDALAPQIAAHVLEFCDAVQTP